MPSAGGRQAAWRLAAGLTALAAVLRFATLTHQSYWLDEGYTVQLLHLGLGSMLRQLRHIESTPPLYDVVAWAWARVFGFGPAGLRSLSALAGTLTVPVVFFAALRIGGRRAAVVAGAIIAVDPLAIWFSQEARAYSVAVLLTAVSLWFFIAIVQGAGRRSGRLWAGWAGASALALATHYFTAFTVGPELLWLVVREWRAGRPRTIWWAGPVVAVAAALAPLAADQASTGHTSFIGEQSLSRRVVQVPKQLLVGYATPGQAFAAILAVALVLVALAGLWRDPRRERRGVALVVLGVAVAAVAVPIVLSVIGIDYLDTRNLLPGLPVLTVALGVGFAALDPVALRSLAPAGLLAVMLVVTVLGVTATRYQRDDWRGVARTLARLPAQPAGRILLISPGSGWIALSAFDREIRDIPKPYGRAGEVDVVATASRGADGGGATPPRPGPAFAVPVGFALEQTITTETYTVVRLRALRPPTVVDAPTLIVAALAPDAAAFVDGPG